MCSSFEVGRALVLLRTGSVFFRDLWSVYSVLELVCVFKGTISCLSDEIPFNHNLMILPCFWPVVSTWLYIHMCAVCVCIYVCVQVCMYVCVCVCERLCYVSCQGFFLTITRRQIGHRCQQETLSVYCIIIQCYFPWYPLKYHGDISRCSFCQFIMCMPSS